MTVGEYAKKYGISEHTVYRKIEKGEIAAEKCQGNWTILVKDDLSEKKDNSVKDNEQDDQLIEQLRDEIEYLREKLDQAQEDRQRADTIIMQLTKQLEKQTLLLEDMRDRSLWKRVKTALGFASP